MNPHIEVILFKLDKKLYKPSPENPIYACYHFIIFLLFLQPLLAFAWDLFESLSGMKSPLPSVSILLNLFFLIFFVAPPIPMVPKSVNKSSSSISIMSSSACWFASGISSNSISSPSIFVVSTAAPFA